MLCLEAGEVWDRVTMQLVSYQEHLSILEVICNVKWVRNVLLKIENVRLFL